MSQTPDFAMNGLMHRAFLRDLDRISDEVDSDPTMARRRWKLFSGLLRDHHTAEDTYLWPLVEQRSADAGETQILHDMEAEHGELSDTLQSCDALLGPTTGAVDVTAARERLAALREVLKRHCDHEERAAEPLLAKYVSKADLEPFQKANRASEYSMLVFPWIADGAAGQDAATASGYVARPRSALLEPLMNRKYRQALAA